MFNKIDFKKYLTGKYLVPGGALLLIVFILFLSSNLQRQRSLGTDSRAMELPGITLPQINIGTPVVTIPTIAPVEVTATGVSVPAAATASVPDIGPYVSQGYQLILQLLANPTAKSILQGIVCGGQSSTTPATPASTDSNQPADQPDNTDQSSSSASSQPATTACGYTSGNKCCDGNNCFNALLTCDAQTGKCIDCGKQAGQKCCTESGTKFCFAGSLMCNEQSNTCVSCGQKGEDCCSSPLTNGQEYCVSPASNPTLRCNAAKKCEECGMREGELCCADFKCGGESEALTCNRGTNRCEICGQKGVRCCSGSTCLSQDLYCGQDNTCYQR